MQSSTPQISRSRTPGPAQLAFTAALLVLLAALVFACAQRADAASSSAFPPEKPSFVLIQTDDETLDQLYSVFNAGGLEIPAMPNTLAMIARRGISFNR